MKKKRLDQLLVEQGLAPSRTRAQSMILAGMVLVDDQPATKAGTQVSVSAAIRIRGKDHPYVSRGGIKLKKALDEWKIPVAGRVGLDIGASTGGFTQVLLIEGAARVYAVDVGYNQLDWSIRQDPRVVVLEKTNARYIQFDQIGQKADIIVVDVSFISLEKILPALLQFADRTTDWITLIKPQFEVGRSDVGKGGIVKSSEAQNGALERLRAFGESIGLHQVGLIESPIRGTDGNKEFLAYWKIKSIDTGG